MYVFVSIVFLPVQNQSPSTTKASTVCKFIRNQFIFIFVVIILMINLVNCFLQIQHQHSLQVIQQV